MSVLFFSFAVVLILFASSYVVISAEVCCMLENIKFLTFQMFDAIACTRMLFDTLLSSGNACFLPVKNCGLN